MHVNNINLIRLLAALQVYILHSKTHLEIEKNYDISFLLDLIRPFPGVPIFFILSGFLITISCNNSDNLKIYFIKRFLRIYPLLILITVFTLILIVNFSNPSINDIIIWVISQLTLAQFFTPNSFHDFGIGVPNGALWTISIEIVFYTLLPVLLFIKKKYGQLYLIIIATICLIINSLPIFIENSLSHKIYQISIIPYLPHFIIGIFIADNKEKMKEVVANKLFLSLLIYLISYFISFEILGISKNLYQINIQNLPTLICLTFLIFSLAYNFKAVSNKILSSNDLSYSLYVIHMPIINVFVELNLKSDLRSLFALTILCFFISYLLWNYFEKPILKFKNNFR